MHRYALQSSHRPVLLAKLRDPSAGVAARVLTALGELAQVAGEDIVKYLDQLLPMIIEALQVRARGGRQSGLAAT